MLFHCVASNILNLKREGYAATKTWNSIQSFHFMLQLTKATEVKYPREILLLLTYVQVPLENLKGTLSLSQIPENDTLSLMEQNFQEKYPVLEFLETKLCAALQICRKSTRKCGNAAPRGEGVLGIFVRKGCAVFQGIIFAHCFQNSVSKEDNVSGFFVSKKAIFFLERAVGRYQKGIFCHSWLLIRKYLCLSIYCRVYRCVQSFEEGFWSSENFWWTNFRKN